MTSRTGRNSGLTLIELLLSVVLYASVAVVVLPALGNASQMTQMAKRRSEAYQHALKKLSELELLYSGTDEAPDEDNGRFRSRGEGPTPYTWRVFSQMHSEEPPLRKVRLVVSWPRGNGSDELALETVLRLREKAE